MDVKSTFLNEDLREEVYICQPARFIIAGQARCCMVCGRLHGHGTQCSTTR
jgi:hypothetical protein